MTPFYIYFLETCLRKETFKPSLPRQMSLSEMDFYHATATDIIMGKFDIDCEQRECMGEVENYLRGMARLIDEASSLRSSLANDMTFCSEAIAFIKNTDASKQDIVFHKQIRMYKQKRRCKLELSKKIETTLGQVKAFYAGMKWMRGEERLNTQHLNVIEIVLEKVIQNLAIQLFGIDGKITPSEQDSLVFHSLDLSLTKCKELISVSKKLSKFWDFVISGMVGIDELLDRLALVDSGAKDIGGFSKLSDFTAVISDIHDIRNDILAQLDEVVFLDLTGLLSEFRSVRDYHSGKIVNSQTL